MSRSALCVAAFLASVAVARADGPADAISGCVSRTDGSPIVAAAVSVRGLGGFRGTARTDARGCFALAHAAASAMVRVDATGFEPFVRGDVRAGSAIAITLAPATTALVTIGRVAVAGNDGVSSASAPSVTRDARRAARLGAASVAEMLDGELSLTALRPVGGGSNAPRVFALRGPDPTETLVDIDGHEVNNSNTGDFDLSLLAPSDLESVELVYGIAPSSLVGPNTIGGAINLRTLEPTSLAHGLARFRVGSYGTVGSTVQATGTSGRIGYALSYDRQTAENDVFDRAIPYADANSGEARFARVGSGSRATSALMKTRYAFGATPSAGYVEASVRDQGVVRDESAALSSALPSGFYTNAAGAGIASHNAGYALDVRLPVGALDAFGNAAATVTFRHLSSIADRSVTGAIADSSSNYFFNDRDGVGDDSFEFDRSGATTSFSLKAMLRTERLHVPFDALSSNTQSDQSRARGGFAPSAVAALVPADASERSQTQRSFVARYAFDAAARVHATLATYFSNFSTFGTSLDPRLGLVWTPNAETALRASFGTTFQPPTLTALFVPDPLPDATNALVHIGNPNLKADRAAEYDLGAERALRVAGAPARVSLDLYRTNLRTPAQTFVPASGTGYSYPINIGGAVYEGIQIRIARDVGARAKLALGYSIDRAYATAVPDGVGGGSLVAGQQFLGVPLQRGFATFGRERTNGISYDLGGTFEARNNELNRPAFATLDAAVGYERAGYRLDLTAKNLTNVYANGFTRRGAGTPYAGADGPIPLDAYALSPSRFTLAIARRF